MNDKVEKWDLYDLQGNLVRTMRRGEGYVPKGLYHITVEIVATDCAGHILVTQRDMSKARGAGKWEFPAGSAISGESAARAAARELKEETGLKATSMAKIQERHIPGMLRVAYLAYIPDLLTATIKLQEGETSDYRVITLDEWFTMLAHGMFDPSRTALYGERFYNTVEAKVSGGLKAKVPEGSPPVQQEAKPAEKVEPKQPKQFVPASLPGSEE